MFTRTPAELDMAWQIADAAAGLVITFGLPAMGAWAVRKGLIQQRWVSMIDAGAGVALAAGQATGRSINDPQYRLAAEAALLAYAKSQGADILKSKGLTDDQTIEAGMARLSKLTGGAIGPNGLSASPLLALPTAAAA